MKTDWISLAKKIGKELAARAAKHDDEGSFVDDNYALLKEHRFMSAQVPEELGGGGASHREMCEVLRELARHCASTALAFSMTQHLVAATVWKYRKKGAGEPLLRRIVDEQLVMVSTGATDWIDSNGEMRRVPGGYRVNARKVFGSGGPAADLLITSAPYNDPVEGRQVLHFPVPFSAEGVRSLSDWNTHGMRGTGSNTVLYEEVFVPDEAIALVRSAGEWHPVWATVVTLAMPLIMAVYVGMAEAARDIAADAGSKKPDDPYTPFILGEMECELYTARTAWESMVANAQDGELAPTVETANTSLIGKTVVGRAAKAAVEKAVEATGGRGFFRGFPLERMLRDVHAAPFHPLPEKKQALFSGRIAMGLDPITGKARESATPEARPEPASPAEAPCRVA